MTPFPSLLMTPHLPNTPDAVVGTGGRHRSSPRQLYRAHLDRHQIETAKFEAQQMFSLITFPLPPPPILIGTQTSSTDGTGTPAVGTPETPRMASSASRLTPGRHGVDPMLPMVASPKFSSLSSLRAQRQQPPASPRQRRTLRTTLSEEGDMALPDPMPPLSQQLWTPELEDVAATEIELWFMKLERSFAHSIMGVTGGIEIDLLDTIEFEPCPFPSYYMLVTLLRVEDLPLRADPGYEGDPPHPYVTCVPILGCGTRLRKESAILGEPKDTPITVVWKDNNSGSEANQGVVYGTRLPLAYAEYLLLEVHDRRFSWPQEDALIGEAYIALDTFRSAIETTECCAVEKDASYRIRPPDGRCLTGGSFKPRPGKQDYGCIDLQLTAMRSSPI